MHYSRGDVSPRLIKPPYRLAINAGDGRARAWERAGTKRVSVGAGHHCPRHGALWRPQSRPRDWGR